MNATQWQNHWTFATRNSDSGKTILDEKRTHEGFPLYGVISVLMLHANEVRVSNPFNRVTATFILAQTVRSRGLIRITYDGLYSK